MKKYLLVGCIIPMIFLAGCNSSLQNSNQSQTSNSTQKSTTDQLTCESSDADCALQKACNSADIREQFYDQRKDMGGLSKEGDMLYYFQSNSGAMYDDLDFQQGQKQYIYAFNRYDCITHQNKELAGTGTMTKLLEFLPPQKTSGMYIPLLGNDDTFGRGYSYFWNILRFSYSYQIPGREGPLGIGEYSVTLNTEKHTVFISDVDQGTAAYATGVTLQ